MDGRVHGVAKRQTQLSEFHLERNVLKFNYGDDYTKV